MEDIMKEPKVTSEVRTFIVFDKDVVIDGERYYKAGRRMRWWYPLDAGVSVGHPCSLSPFDTRHNIPVSPDHYHFEEEIVTKTVTTSVTKTVRRI
jgi:hypothetical protein